MLTLQLAFRASSSCLVGWLVVGTLSKVTQLTLCLCDDAKKKGGTACLPDGLKWSLRRAHTYKMRNAQHDAEGKREEGP